MKTDISEADLEGILNQKFKLPTFRKGQRDIIASVLNANDTLAVMPTGGGKSLCYQLPAIVQKGIVIVISPLIALMQDQVRTLKELGIPVGCLYSGQSFQEKQIIFSEIKSSDHFILYLSPERVQKEGFASWIKLQKISLFAIDESHCVSQWGPDFRKDYYRLNLLRELRPDVPILALTATATPPVLKDIEKQLQLRTPSKHIHGFYRPNLYFQVEWCDDESEKTIFVRQGLNQTPAGKVIIYCGTRKQTEELTNDLQDTFDGIDFYHAGLSTEQRKKVQSDFSEGKTRILIATNAFGMGIDNADVRLVIHFQMPANIESYYQEIGRAGRDGNESTCLLLYSKKDKGLHSYFIQKSESDSHSINQRWRALDTIVKYSEGGECRHSGILTYFKDSFRMKACGHCDVCATDSLRRIKISKSKPPLLEKKKVRNSSANPKQISEAPLTPQEEVRMEQLKKWRKDYADENDIPAFIVFSNKTLKDLAQKAPSTIEDFKKIYGFGPQKTEHLGALVLDQLRLCETADKH